MAVLLLRCIVDASLRHEGRPLAAWLRDVAAQVGALAEQGEAGSRLGTDTALSCVTLWDMTLRAAELRIQSTPDQCALISQRISEENVPIFLMKVLDCELSTFFAPA